MYRITTPDFNLDHTLSCGQVFRWQKNGNLWTGVVNGAVIRARQEREELIIDSILDRNFIREYFRLDDDMVKIYESINRDALMDALIRKYRGLRLVRQDPWECLVSYICSSNNTIRNIKNSISRMCECFGKKIGSGYYSFPEPEMLAVIETCQMQQCRLGFRSSRVLEIASRVAEGEFDLYGLGKLSYQEARLELVKIHGVGNKIADCVLLFAFGKLESFPVDTHIEKIMELHYGSHITGTKSKRKEAIAGFARRYFGGYCGYAQEYLYFEDLGT
ncbi:MAG: DNA-3-methyladenine glycosylase family protein [Candidatus Methanoperedens sp.]